MNSNIHALLQILVPNMQPEEIYLFGSHARDDAHANSDIDLFLIMPDDAPAEKLRLNYVSHLLRDSKILSDAIPCRRSRFEARKDEFGTLSHAVASEGIQIYARQ